MKNSRCFCLWLLLSGGAALAQDVDDVVPVATTACVDFAEFSVFAESETFQEAKLTCSGFGADLARISSDTEHFRVVELLTGVNDIDDDEFWIGNSFLAINFA